MPEPKDKPNEAEGARLADTGHIDQSAGGADSAPLENVPSGEKAAAARERSPEGRDTGRP